MENINKHDFEQVTNEEPSHVQEIFAPIEQVNNMLPTCNEPIQPIQFKLVELVQPKPIYIFPKMLATYVQHENLKQVTLFFEKVALVAQTWPQTVDILTNLKTKYNYSKSMLKDTNNQLQAHCLKPVSHKQTLQNKDKDLVTMKT